MYETWKRINFHVIEQGWGSTCCGWEGIGGSTITQSYTTVIENGTYKIVAIYYNGKLAYLVHLDEKYKEFILTHGFHLLPGLDSVKGRLNLIYKNKDKHIMVNQPVYIFQPQDYVGELNLNALERRIIVRELKKTQRMNKASELLGFSTRSLDRKIKGHQIKEEEWKESKVKFSLL